MRTIYRPVFIRKFRMRNELLLSLLLALLLPFPCYSQGGEEPSSSPHLPQQGPSSAQLSSPIEPMLHRLEGEERQGYYSLATSETVSEKKLEAMLKKLEKTRLMLAVREETKEKDVYRLVADCYPDRTTAEKRLVEISRRGIRAFVSHAGETFCAIAGSLMSEAAALKEQKRLAGKNLPTGIVKVKVPLTVFGLNIGRFNQLQEAQEAAKSIAAQGIEVTVVKIGPPAQFPNPAR